MERLKLTAILYPQENGAYTIVCPEINKTTQGDTIEDALFMMRNLADDYIVNDISSAEELQEMKLAYNFGERIITDIVI